MPDYSDIYKPVIDKIFIDMITLTAEVKEGASTVRKTLYFCNNTEPVTFLGNTYMPAVFNVTEPDRNNLEACSGSVGIAGVTDEYIQILQTVVGSLEMKVGVIRLDQASSGQYILPPLSYTVESTTIVSSSATVNLALKTGGSLGFFVSTKRFDTTDFPGLEG